MSYNSSLSSLCIDFIASKFDFFIQDATNLIILPVHIKEKFLKKLLKRPRYSRNLNFNQILTVLIHPRLRIIDLSSVECLINDTTLEKLKICQEYLYEINLKDCHGISSYAMMDLFRKMENLTIVDVSNCRQFNDLALESLAVNCCKIVGLYMENSGITDRGFTQLTTLNNKLKFVSISKTTVSGDSISTAVQNKKCLDLIEFRIDSCPMVSNDVLRNIYENCPKMEILTFYNCDIVVEQTSIFEEMSTLKNLKQLNWTVPW